MSERDKQNDILLEHGHGDNRLFRNNTGTGWQGAVKRLSDGSLLIRNPRPLHAGLCVGSSDLIGLRRVLITPDMVGRLVGLFVAIEVKDKAKATEDQAQFLGMVREFGGLAGVAHNPAEAAEILGVTCHAAKP